MSTPHTRVLLAVEDFVTRTLVTSALAAKGCEIACVDMARGNLVSDIVSEAPDVLLFDVAPVVADFETMVALRTAELPMVAIGTRTDVELEQIAEFVGASSFLRTPLCLEDVVDEVSAALIGPIAVAA